MEIVNIFFRHEANEWDLYLGSCAVYRVWGLSEGSMDVGWASWFLIALYYTSTRYKQLLLLLHSDHLLALKEQLTDFSRFQICFQRGIFHMLRHNSLFSGKRGQGNKSNNSNQKLKPNFWSFSLLMEFKADFRREKALLHLYAALLLCKLFLLASRSM